METTDVDPLPRWHHLDALRGFAMVLGIALHVSMSFFVGFWVVRDVTADDDGWFDEFFHGIHGFRMPLFFLLSGFFTTMLWRRRGPGRLVRHRLRRIAAPLAIGMITVVPAVTWSIEWAIDNGVSDHVEETGDIWTAVYFGHVGAVEVLLERGVDVDAANPTQDGETPLHIAAFAGDATIAELLLDRGADPRRPATTGATPMDYAVFAGSAAVAEVLVDAGVTDPRTDGGGWTDLDVWAAGAEEVEATAAKFGLESWLTSFYHLWFLWFLLWLIAGFVVVAFAVERLPSGSDRLGSVVMWGLIPAVLGPQLLMGDEGAIRVFGPDTSTGIVPIWHVLAYYGCFFAFGALLFGRVNRAGRPLVETIGRWWPVLLPAGFLVVFPVALHVTFETDMSWLLASVLQVAYAWLAIVSLLGVFAAVLAVERRWVRYLSDSAYWLYLAHLPVVIVAQSAIRNWEFPAAAKFIGLTTAITAGLLVSYQLGVRYTAIGALLNGSRSRPATRRAAPAAEPFDPVGSRTPSMHDGHGTEGSAMGPQTGDDDTAIRATGLTRRFGDNVAVSGIDLTIGVGELFSLLGPNGAGKTTTIRMLCCLLRPSGGTASVLGHDIHDEPIEVKRVIGVSPQETAVAPNLTATENLMLLAGLHGIESGRARRRVDELLEVIGLTDRADDKAKTFSGGMQRRLSIAMALASDPDVLFLDEPTIGLDPQARRTMWEYIAGLKGDTTIVLTTHYLEEADALADRIGVIDDGSLVALGTPAELKERIAGTPVMLVESTHVGDDALAALRRVYPATRRVDHGVEVTAESPSVYEIGDTLRPFGVEIHSTALQRVSLDDVFLELTGKELRE